MRTAAGAEIIIRRSLLYSSHLSRCSKMNKSTSIRQIRLERRSPAYWRVTFDLPPLNIFGPENIPQLEEVIKSIESDKHVKVVVFDSAVEGFFLTHYDFLAKLEATTSLPWSDRSAASARYAGALEPCSRGVDCFHSRARHRSGKRTCACVRHAFCESRKGHSLTMGSWRRTGAGRWSGGEIAAIDGAGPRFGSVAGCR